MHKHTQGVYVCIQRAVPNNTDSTGRICSKMNKTLTAVFHSHFCTSTGCMCENHRMRKATCAAAGVTISKGAERAEKPRSAHQLDHVNALNYDVMLGSS